MCEVVYLLVCGNYMDWLRLCALQSGRIILMEELMSLNIQTGLFNHDRSFQVHIHTIRHDCYENCIQFTLHC